jgi:cyclase
MKTKRIIAALDIRDGRVVKGVQFINIRDIGDPVEAALAYQAAGIDEIVLLDINATYENRGTVISLVSDVAAVLTIPFTVSGGIRSLEDASALRNAGADKICVGSAAIADPSLISVLAEKFGSSAVAVSIDAKRAGGGWLVYTHGGRTPTETDAIAWAAESARRGAGEIVLTSMDCDGAGNGYDIALTRAAAQASGIPIVASGGAGCIEHFAEALTEGCADAALAATLFHDKIIEIPVLKEALRQRGIPVRIQNGKL